jgi:DUF1680 family protein
MYGDCRSTLEHPDGSMVVISMNSDYPWDGEIEFVFETVESGGDFPVYLRVPQWADNWGVAINGERLPTEGILDQGFIELRRNWQAGDRIVLSLPMPVVANESHPMVEESRNHVALTRGPIVYCLESADLPPGTDIADVYIDPNEDFSFEKETVASTELGVLKGRLLVSKAPAWQPGALYRKLGVGEFENLQATLVPYFAWDNREEGEMTVWLPLLPSR